MFRFDRVVVDVATRVVELDGEARHLEPQAFDLLAYLVEHRDRVVPKAELLDEVWGDQFVSESALTTRIKEVRRAVGDDGNRQQVVRTFRGRGYRFVAAAVDGPVPTRVEDRAVAATAGVIGREDDLASIDNHLGDHLLVTLVGPGGVGKTTLARAAAVRVRDRFPGGVIGLSLASIRDGTDVVPVLRRAAGLTDPGIDEEGLLAAVAGLDALVIVDNCEHVLDEASRLVEVLAGSIGDGGTRILATSRERLGIGREQVHPVMPLGPDAARDLLVARAQAAQPGFTVQPGEDDDIDRLVGMLDRLPLAIEMAAARLGQLGAADLTQHLTGRLDLLRAPNRGVEERHRTVADLVEWSESLLDDEARTLLAELSVFAGAVTAEDIAAVVGADAGELVFGPLATLVDHSLVVADRTRRPTRYRVLETVRATVARRRDVSADERHARHVISVVAAADRRLRTPEEGPAAARIEGLVEEIRLAHRWARAHDLALAAELSTALLGYAEERQWAEPASWSRDALRRADGYGGPVDRAPFAASIATDAAHRGDYAEARASAALALESDDPIVVASGHDTLANVGIYDGDVDASMRHGAAMIEIGEAIADTSIWTLGLLPFALAPLYDGRVAEARRVLDEGIPPGPLGPTSEAWVAYAEAEVLAAEGDDEGAITGFERAIELASAVGSVFVVSVARTSVLPVRARAGGIDAALAEFATVLVHHRRTSAVTHGITTLRNLVELLVRADRDDMDELAMVLLGALSGPSVKSTYGHESELLDRAQATVAGRHGDTAVEAWLAAGAAHDPAWAIDHAIDAIDPLDAVDPVDPRTPT